MIKAARSIVSSEGASALLTGFGPTAVGYLVQGGAKFAGYEFFKRQFASLAGDPERATKHRTAIYLSASASAEFFADILLSPLEATRIRLVSQRGCDGLSSRVPATGKRGRDSAWILLRFHPAALQAGTLCSGTVQRTRGDR